MKDEDMALSVRLLRVFQAVAREGGIAAAGRRLNLAPASVSQAITDLEATLGRPLFEREQKRLRLNARGASLLLRADSALNDLASIERDFRHERFRLDIGASVTVGNYMLPQLLLRLARLHPEFDVSVTIRNTAAIADAVEKFKMAIAFVEGEVSTETLRVRPWRVDELILVTPPYHPLSGIDVMPDDLAEATWVLREAGSGTRATFEMAAHGHFVPKRIAFDVGGNELLKQAVLGDIGIGCLSREAARREIDDGLLVELSVPWLNMRRQLSIISHPRKVLDGPLEALIRLCDATDD